MVESQPSKLLVAGSIPVSRSMLFNNLRRWSGGVLRLCSVNFASLSKILRNQRVTKWVVCSV